MNPTIKIDLPNVEATECFARRLAQGLSAPMIMTFQGEIGAGKTTLIRAMLRALGVQSAIKSPTFSLVESYLIESLCIHHFDLYRIHDETELEYIGFRDYFTANAVCLIEWPERAMNDIHPVDINISFEFKGLGRQMEYHANSPKGMAMLSRIIGEK